MTEKKKTDGLHIDKKTIISITAILLAVYILAGALTRILPRGEYNTFLDEETGKYSITQESEYQPLEDYTMPLWKIIAAPVMVFVEDETRDTGFTGILIIAFIVLMGGTFLLLDRCGVLKYLVALVVKKFSRRKYLLMAVLTLFCMALASTAGILEESVTLVPIAVAISLALGWDSLVGLGMSLIAVSMGSATSNDRFTSCRTLLDYGFSAYELFTPEVSKEELPLVLPNVESYEPTDNGESPLAKMTDWVNTTCPHCGAPAKRETDTMPQWAGSSWYFLRYCDPNNDGALASKEALDYWMPVDWYNGGMEHVTRHLIYSRFWHKFLYDIGAVTTSEPYAKRTAQGLILGPDGVKMSKSRGNVVDPNDVVDEYGADVLRVYVLFMGDYEQAAPWSESSLKGCKRFLDRIWNMQDILVDGDSFSKELSAPLHRTIKKVSEDIEALKFNTAIASMMAFVNNVYEKGSINKAELKALITILNPFAPHMTEEMYQNVFGGILSEQAWAEYDEALCIEETVEVVVQINGKVRAKMNIPADMGQDDMIKAALENETIKPMVDGKTIVKSIAVPKKLINIVVK